MPIDQTQVPGQIPDAELPKGPVLAIMRKDGQFMPLPMGTVMAVVGDVTNPATIYPLVLTKVSLKKLTLACACGDPSCSKIVEATFSRSGLHRVSR